MTAAQDVKAAARRSQRTGDTAIIEWTRGRETALRNVALYVRNNSVGVYGSGHGGFRGEHGGDWQVVLQRVSGPVKQHARRRRSLVPLRRRRSRAR